MCNVGTVVSGDLLFELPDALLRHKRGIAVGTIELGEISRDALLELLLSSLDLMGREVLVPIDHRLELAAIFGHQSLVEQPNLAAKLYKLRADLTDRRTIVAAEVGYCLEVRCQPSLP